VKKVRFIYRNGNCHCSYATLLYCHSLMLTTQSPKSPTFDSAAGTVQCHAVHAGSEPAASHPVLQRLPAASLLPGSPVQDAADLQAAAKCRYLCIHNATTTITTTMTNTTTTTTTTTHTHTHVCNVFMVARKFTDCAGHSVLPL